MHNTRTIHVSNILYRCIVHEQPINLGEVTVDSPAAGGARRIPLPAAIVTVLSVLPDDVAARVPKPARGVFAQPLPWWYPWLPFLVLASLLVAIFIWWYRRRGIAVRQPAERALERAQAEFSRIEAMRLVEAGERGRHVVLMVDALREFLAARFAAASPALTSAEILSAIEQGGEAPVARLAVLFYETDLVKFAQRPLTSAAAIKLGREAVEIARAIGNPGPLPFDDAGTDREDAA